MKESNCFRGVVVALIAMSIIWLAMLVVGVKLVHAESRRYVVTITYPCNGHWNTTSYEFRSEPRAKEAKKLFKSWARYKRAKISVGLK